MNFTPLWTAALNAFSNFIIVDEHCRIAYMNKPYTEILNVQLEDVIGKPIKSVIPTTKLPEVMASGKAHIGALMTLYDHKTGKDISFVCNRIPLIEDGEVLYFDQIKIQAIYTPGHTLGHMCYLVDDKILISGDCLAINRYGGYSFFDFFTQYPDMNKESLCRLKDYVADKNLLWVCTGHSGAVRNTVNLFSHIDESATLSRKKPFDENGPFDYTKE